MSKIEFKTETQVIAEVEEYGFKWHMEAQFPITSIVRDDKTLQCRLSNVAPEEKVKQYAEMMRSGAAFPPVIISSDGYVIAGNTRIAAMSRLKHPFIYAVVIDEPYGTTGEKRRHLFGALSTTTNMNGPTPLTPAEVQLNARHFFELDFTNEAISKRLGLDPRKIARYRRDYIAEKRASKMGLRIPDGMSKLLTALGEPGVMVLNDRPWKDLFLLARDADLTQAETVAVGKLTADTKAEGLACKLLAEQRNDTLANRIALKALTGQGKPAFPERIRRIVEKVFEYEGKEGECVETSRNSAENYLEQLKRALDIMSAIYSRQQDAVGTLTNQAAE